MEAIKIRGGRPLDGSIELQGAKNSVLPILAACIINGGVSVIHNCPDLTDVQISFDILRHLGCSVSFEDGTATVDSTQLVNCDIPDSLMRSMRSSVIFMGALINRLGKAEASYPGGCNLGHRPIDLHLKAFESLGIITEEEHGKIACTSQKIDPCTIFLEFPSVGATENIMLAACRSGGTTTILNAAREPEIADLQRFLNAMGARIRGGGTEVVEIEGVSSFHSCEHRVIPDRIAAATYMAAAAMAGGRAELRGVIPNHVSAFIAVMRECGASVAVGADSLCLSAPKYIRPVKMINTLPYPGFPTDAQSLMMTVMAKARGTSIIRENIFGGRFTHAAELQRMGADISIADRLAVVRGVRSLSGCDVAAADLRSGAALAAAALGAQGETRIFNVCYIDRGYERFEENLSALGADIERIEVSE